jgi:hypothetical protein
VSRVHWFIRAFEPASVCPGGDGKIADVGPIPAFFQRATAVNKAFKKMVKK